VQCAELHAHARRLAEELADTLRKEGRGSDADTLTLTDADFARRDLVIRLLWEGNADLDLEVSEPTGTVCSVTQRCTPGGGLLQADLDSPDQMEVYSAAQAYSGEYRITVKPRWGKPVAGKAILEIITHRGTPQERIRRESVTIVREPVSLSIQLTDGRRQQLAQVAPIEVYRLGIDPFYRPALPVSGAEMLRRLAVPITTGIEVGRSRLGPTSMAQPGARLFDDGDDQGPQLPPGGLPGIIVIPVGATVSGQALVHSDRRWVRFSGSVTFRGISGLAQIPSVGFPPGPPVP
jgi:hypothetical protein